MDLLINIIRIASFIGIFLTGYIVHKKSKNEKITCQFKDQCNEVLYSKYSKVLGISTPTLGLLYYILILIGAIFATQELLLPILIVASVAFAFSIFQTSIQIFVLKKWCSWCLETTVLNMLIVVSAALIYAA